MINKCQVKKLEKETNKILKRVFKGKTFAFINRVEIDRDLGLTTITMRMGIYQEYDNKVSKQAVVSMPLMTDIYSLTQLAALFANNGLENMEDAE